MYNVQYRNISSYQDISAFSYRILLTEISLSPKHQVKVF